MSYSSESVAAIQRTQDLELLCETEAGAAQAVARVHLERGRVTLAHRAVSSFLAAELNADASSLATRCFPSTVLIARAFRGRGLPLIPTIGNVLVDGKPYYEASEASLRAEATEQRRDDGSTRMLGSHSPAVPLSTRPCDVRYRATSHASLPRVPSKTSSCSSSATVPPPGHGA